MKELEVGGRVERKEFGGRGVKLRVGLRDRRIFLKARLTSKNQTIKM